MGSLWLILLLEVWCRDILGSHLLKRQRHEYYDAWDIDIADKIDSPISLMQKIPVYGAVDEFNEWGKAPLSELQPTKYFTDQVNLLSVAEENWHWLLLINTTKLKQPEKPLNFDIEDDIRKASDSIKSQDDNVPMTCKSRGSSGSNKEETSSTESTTLGAINVDQEFESTPNSSPITLPQNIDKPQEENVQILRNKIVLADPIRAEWFSQRKEATCQTASVTDSSLKVHFNSVSICSPFKIQKLRTSFTSSNGKMGCRISSSRILAIDGYGSRHKQINTYATWKDALLNEAILSGPALQASLPLVSDGLIIVLNDNHRVLIKSFGRPPLGAVLFRKFEKKLFAIATSADDSLVTHTVMSDDIIVVASIAVIDSVLPKGFEATSPVTTKSLAKIVLNPSGCSTAPFIIVRVTISQL